MDLAIELMVRRHDWNDSWVVHHVAETLKHVECLAQQNGLLLLVERILFCVKLLEKIVLESIQSVPHHDKFIVKLVTIPDVNLADLEVFHLYLNVSLRICYFEVGTSTEHGLLVKL